MGYFLFVFVIFFFIYLLITKVIAFILKRTGLLDKLLNIIRKDETKEISENLPYMKFDYFFTMNEKNFYNIIKPIADIMNVVIFSKVRLADLIYIKSKSNDYYKHWNKIKAKHVDFVICDKVDFKPLFVMELDDKSHDKQERIDRDNFIDNALNVAKLPIFHIKVEYNYNVTYIEEIFKTFTMSKGDYKESM